MSSGRAQVRKDPKVLFGERLKVLRKKKGWSQEKLALEADMDRSYIGGVEQGRRNISLINICRLAKTLNIHQSELLQFPLNKIKK
jgi:transcriptional regulator with XRE-family HTH domain